MNWDEQTLRSKGFAVSDDGTWTKPATRPARIHEPEPERISDGALAEKASGQERGASPPSAEYRLTVTRYGTRWLDADNLAGGFKSLIDGIRAAGLIPDDDPTSTEMVFRQRKVARRIDTGMTVQIERLEKSDHPS